MGETAPLPEPALLSRAHYLEERYVEEHTDLDEVEPNYKNVGWSLGNYCPLRCTQCYSESARQPGGENLTEEAVDRVVNQLADLGVETVNLGGNEPIYTNGRYARDSLLPYILDSISDRGMLVGLTTSGVTLTKMRTFFPEHIKKINDVDISLDSPYPEEHDRNRGSKGIFDHAMRALEITQEYGIPRSFIMCGMNWNFTPDRINAMIDLAVEHQANFRINPMKPIEPEHMNLILTPQQFYEGLDEILKRCDPIDLSDPAWASSVGVPSSEVSGCACGVSSFRIHSITPDGQMPISPCIYLHDYKAGDLQTQDVNEILESPQFKAFRRRKANPEAIEGCNGCSQIEVCGGGCAARPYLHTLHEEGDDKRTLFVKDPYCPQDFADNGGDMENENISIHHSDDALVHEGYLCTGIFAPKDC